MLAQELREKVRKMDEFDGKIEFFRAVESVPGRATVRVEGHLLVIETPNGIHVKHEIDDQLVVGLTLMGL